MKTLLNYSHPLSDVAKKEIQEQVGDFEEVRVPVHLDMDEDIYPQVKEIITKTYTMTDTFDFIIPPGHSTAAYFISLEIVTRYFSTNKLPKVVWLKLENGAWGVGGIE